MTIRRNTIQHGAVRFSLALVLCSLTALSYAAPGPQMSLTNDKFTITGSGASAGFSQTGTITSDAGAISKIADVPTTSGVGIPSFSFDLALANADESSTYTFKVAVIIEDKDHPMRRMEASIGTLNLKVLADATTVTGDIPTQALTVHGQDGGGNTRITVTNAQNNSANGPITISGGSVSFNGANLITRIRNANTLFDTILLPEFDQIANYNYWIVVQQTAGTAVQFGRSTGGFTAFTGQPVTSTYMQILTPFTAGAYTPYSVNGEFNVKPFSSGGGDTTPPTTTVEADTTALNIVVDELTVKINNGTATETEITNFVKDAQALLVKTQNQTTTLSPAAAVNVTRAIVSTFKVVQAAAAKGSNTDKQLTSDVLSKGTAVLKDVSGADGLSVVDAGSIGGIAQDLLDVVADEITVTATDKDIETLKSLLDVFVNTEDVTKDGIKVEVIEKISQTTTKFSQDVCSAGDPSTSTQLSGLSFFALHDAEGVSGSAQAASSDAQKKKIARLFKKLKRLPNGRTPPSKVKNLAQKLVKLSPIKAERYYKIATQKYATVLKRGAVQESIVNRITKSISKGQVPITNCDGSTSGSTPALTNGLSIFAATAAPEFAQDPYDESILRVTVGEAVYIAESSQTLIVPSFLADGTYPQPDGSILAVSGNIGNRLSSSPADRIGFFDAVTTAGFEIDFRADGGIDIDLGADGKFSGVFALDNVAGFEGECGAITIANPTGAVNSPEYSFAVNCANGISQRVMPYIADSTFYELGEAYNAEITTDRDTGIITITGIGQFKPSFYSTALTAADQAFFDANALEGFAFRARDVNGDGKMDYEAITATKVQTLYGL